MSIIHPKFYTGIPVYNQNTSDGIEFPSTSYFMTFKNIRLNHQL